MKKANGDYHHPLLLVEMALHYRHGMFLLRGLRRLLLSYLFWVNMDPVCLDRYRYICRVLDGLELKILSKYFTKVAITKTFYMQ